VRALQLSLGFVRPRLDVQLQISEADIEYDIRLFDLGPSRGPTI
jgi:hypothetical protein